MSDGALDGIRVLDLTDDYGVYAGRLLAGLGATVVRVEDDERAAPPRPEPVRAARDRLVSFFDEFVNAGKMSVAFDVASEEGADALSRLVEASDVVISGGDGREPGGWAVVNPRVVHVVVTPFGWDHRSSWRPVDDLITLGAGGLLYLGGYPDMGPIGPFGGQSQLAAGIFAAVAVLVGLLEREETGSGNVADVSAQEAVAQTLEDSLASFVLTGETRQPQGDEAREAGTGIYACSDGYVSMVAGRLGTARAWSALVEWMSKSCQEATELLKPDWSEFSFRQTPAASSRFKEIFESFAADQSKEELYLEAQARGIALCPVNEIDDLMGDRQLQARSFFSTFHHPGLDLDMVTPGPPYRMSETPSLTLGAAPGRGADTTQVLSSLGFTPDQISALAKDQV